MAFSYVVSWLILLAVPLVLVILWYYKILDRVIPHREILAAYNIVEDKLLEYDLEHNLSITLFQNNWKPTINTAQAELSDNVITTSSSAGSSARGLQAGVTPTSKATYSVTPASKTVSSAQRLTVPAKTAKAAGAPLAVKLYDQSPTTVFGRKFDIKYDSSIGVGTSVARNYLKHLNDAAIEVERFFNYAPKKRITLVIMPKNKFVRALNAPVWTAGHYNNYLREIRLPFEDDTRAKIGDIEELKNILRHEYAHVIIDELSGGKCPIWLNEGLAQVAEGENSRRYNEAFLKNWFKNHKPLTMSELSRSPSNLNSSAVNAYYAQALFLTKYLIKKHGQYKVISYLKRLKDAEPNKDHFVGIFQRTPEKFNTEALSTLGS